MAFDKARFCGVLAPIANPCSEDDELDFDALQANAKRLLETGLTGLYINGGTGDAENLTQKERLATAAYLVPLALEKDKIAIVHVGQTSERCALELTRQAALLGAQAVASIPPRKPWAQVLEYYRAIAAVGVPVIVYYIPGVTGMTADVSALRSLLDIPGVAGIKMSDWNIFLLRCVSLEYPQKIVYSGFDEMLVPALYYGADGCIGTWVNLLPTVYTRIYAQVIAGRIDSVRPLTQEFTAFLSIGWNYGILDTFEELMRERGYANRCFRRPSTWNPGKLPSAVRKDLLKRLEKLEEMAAAL